MYYYIFYKCTSFCMYRKQIRCRTIKYIITTSCQHSTFTRYMTPSSESTTTRTAMTTALNNNKSVPARSTAQHGFGVYQLTTVGASKATIRTLVPVTISAPPYRKALIAKFVFRKILGHAGSPSISCSDLVTSVAIYQV